MKYFSRIAKVLKQERKIGITNLAMAARMNHKRCMSFVRQMESYGYVKVITCGRKREVVITESGIDYFQKLLFVVDPTSMPALLAEGN